MRRCVASASSYSTKTTCAVAHRAVSSRLIHGGLRYLEHAEISLVYESLHERRYLRRVAEHLVKPLRISIPIFKGCATRSLAHVASECWLMTCCRSENRWPDTRCLIEQR